MLKQQYPLYLASQSASRKMLLDKMGVSFQVIGQTACEESCDWSLPVEQLVQEIAQQKMACTQLPKEGKHENGHSVYVICADTLTQGSDGNLYGKPSDYHHAVMMLKNRELHQHARVCTGFCVTKQEWHNGAWHERARVTDHVDATCVFDVSGPWIDYYLHHHPIALKASGAVAIEDFGLQFLKSIDGSFTSVVGLPLYEVRKALEAIGFFSDL